MIKKIAILFIYKQNVKGVTAKNLSICASKMGLYSYVVIVSNAKANIPGKK